MLNQTSAFLDSLFQYLLLLFDNFVTVAEITANSQLADEAFNGIQYYIKIILQAVFDYDDTLETVRNLSLIKNSKHNKMIK